MPDLACLPANAAVPQLLSAPLRSAAAFIQTFHQLKVGYSGRAPTGHVFRVETV